MYKDLVNHCITCILINENTGCFAHHTFDQCRKKKRKFHGKITILQFITVLPYTVTSAKSYFLLPHCVFPPAFRLTIVLPEDESVSLTGSLAFCSEKVNTTYSAPFTASSALGGFILQQTFNIPPGHIIFHYKGIQIDCRFILKSKDIKT